MSQAYANREQHKQARIACELDNPNFVGAYTQASNVYALSYLFKALYEF